MKDLETVPDKIVYYDSDKMKLSFGSLIIKVESINKLFGSLKEFIREYNLWGDTNRKLLIMPAIYDPPWPLKEFAENILVPLGFVEKADYAFVSSLPIFDIRHEISKDLYMQNYYCLEIKWLGSFISEEGNFVWLKKTETRENGFNLPPSDTLKLSGHSRKVFIAYSLYLLEQFNALLNSWKIEEYSGFEDFLLNNQKLSKMKIYDILFYLRQNLERQCINKHIEPEKGDYTRYKLELDKTFPQKTDQEVIDTFNSQVGNYGWGSSRMFYLAAIREEMVKRGWDMSAIAEFDKNNKIISVSYRDKIKLVGKKLELIDSPQRWTRKNL